MQTKVTATDSPVILSPEFIRGILAQPTQQAFVPPNGSSSADGESRRIGWRKSWAVGKAWEMVRDA